LSAIDGIEIGAMESLSPQQRRPAWALRPHRVLGEPGAGQPSIALSEDAFAVAHRHAAGSVAEIGGLLLGGICSWDDATHVEVFVALPAEWTRAGPAHLTLTAESWAGMLARKEREHPAMTIVGWYHSHPRMGIFLSEMDLDIHRGFFREPWHVALVINGQDRRAGCFAWQDGKVRPARHLIWLPLENRHRAIEITAERDRLAYRVVRSRPRRSVAPAVTRDPTRRNPWRR
jgi:proteasome lid subunit RPN8/RPN11